MPTPKRSLAEKDVAKQAFISPESRDAALKEEGVKEIEFLKWEILGNLNNLAGKIGRKAAKEWLETEWKI